MVEDTALPSKLVVRTPFPAEAVPLPRLELIKLPVVVLGKVDIGVGQLDSVVNKGSISLLGPLVKLDSSKEVLVSCYTDIG